MSRWADLVATLWVVCVAVFYFGGYFWSDWIGIHTGWGAVCYLAMLLLSALVLVGRWMRRQS